MKQPLHLVIDYLRQQQLRGITHVALDERARSFLNQLTKQKRVAAAAPPIALATANRIDAQHPTTTAAPVAPAMPITTEGSSKAEKLADLKRQLLTFPQKRGLSQLRQKLIFSQGNPDATIVFVGEAPTYHDEQQGYPFAGMIGERFDSILKAMGLSRSEVYLTYLVKYRPAIKNQTTNNRLPNAPEIQAFLPVLAHEMEIVAPRTIVALGTLVSQALCDSTEPTEALRGQWHQWQKYPVRVTESPSFLSMAGNNKKRKFWEDILAVMEKASLPISERQRRFFLSK